MVGSGSTKIKPGIMVALSVRMGGGVSYVRKDIEKRLDGGTSVSKWETERIIVDAEEHDAAVKVRGAVRYEVAKVCAKTGFGLLCPMESEALLDEAIANAKAAATAWNDTSVYSKIEMYVLKGRIAATDQEAADAIAGELRGLLDEMEAALKDADPEAIRETANKARQIGMMLADDGGAVEVEDAIKAARKVARQIVARVEKGSEDASTVLAEVAADGFAAISTARFALLSTVSEADEPSEEASILDVLPSTDVSRFSGLDFGEESAPEVAPEAAPQGLVVVLDDEAAPEVAPQGLVRLTVEEQLVAVLDDEAAEVNAVLQALDNMEEGKPCPTCSEGQIIRGKTSLGCSRWRLGCEFRAPFQPA